MQNVIKLMGAMILTTFSVSAFANPILGDTCGAPEVIGTVSSAVKCAYAPNGSFDPNGTFKVEDINFLYGDGWEMASERTGNGSDSYFSANVTGPDAGSAWGDKPPVDGEWTISDLFWDDYDEAVISIHIGNTNPDNWAWLMLDGVNAGTWSLDFIAPFCDAGPTTGPDKVCNGGGLSNIKLWGRGDGGDVPEPGMVALLAVGLLGMVAVRRKKTV